MRSFGREVLDYKSAVAICPPKETWHAIQSFRWYHDKQILRWPPHINLLYPCVSQKFPDAIAEAESAIAAACATVAPFTILLDHTNHFLHNKRSATLWLNPSADGNDDALEQMQAGLEASLPMCDDLRCLGDGSVRHHLSIGQFTPRTIAQYEAKANELICPMQFPVDAVHLLTRSDYYAPFEVRRSFALGGARSEAGADSPNELSPFNGVYQPQLAAIKDALDIDWPPKAVPYVALLSGEAAVDKLRSVYPSERVTVLGWAIEPCDTDMRAVIPLQREKQQISNALLVWLEPKEFARRAAAVKWSEAVPVQAHRASGASVIHAVALIRKDKK